MNTDVTKRGDGWGWVGQALSGVLLLGLLGLHMIAHHFLVEGGLRDYAAVLNYVSSPAILAREIIFLVVVAYHALVGVRSVIFDLGLTPAQERTVTGLLFVVGVVTVGYGVWLALTLFSRA
jgi:succinate dehydrogenase hydrophobic anchor subunit